MISYWNAATMVTKNAVPSQNLNPDIMVMQPTQNWDGRDGAKLLRAPNFGCILAQ